MGKKPDLDLLKKGAWAWNKWREESPEIIPDLSAADLGEIDLFGVNLKNSDLQKAHLTRVKNLVNAQLGGSNLSGAKLPEESLKFEGILQVESAIKYTQRIFVVMVFGCVYTWLTVATTSDANLITNSSFSPLPIIGNKIQIGGFYVVAPVLLVCVYFYLHIYLQRLWERLSTLPAFFPDGQSVDQKINPWFPTGLLYKDFKLLTKCTPPLSRLQHGFQS
jgi:Pentapeptide repeats (8 copies)